MRLNLTCDHIQMGFLGRFSESSVILCAVCASEGYQNQQFAPLKVHIFGAPPTCIQFTVSCVGFHTESPLR
jgi:hypothetical protein